jgi:hypothetical protein
MALIKPNENWKDESGGYDGPPPDPGTYTGEVVRMGLSTVQKGDNAGADKWVVSVKITEGKFKGATILHNFVMLKQSAWSFNQFLKAMTDGSEKQKETILSWYYEKGFSVEDQERYKNLGRQCEFIGKPAFKPIGKKVRFVVTRNGEYTNIDRFLVPLEDSGEDGETEVLAEAEEATVDDSDGFADEATDEPEVEESVAEEDSDDDDDDPWG